MIGAVVGSVMVAMVSVGAPVTQIRVESVLARGVGTLQLDRRYPLGDLIYTGSSAGRGVLSLQAGAGHIRLSGADADHPSSTTYVLHLDRLDIASTRPVVGDCTLTLSADQRTYRTLRCKGSIPTTRERFALSWRGDGQPAEAVTP